MSGFSGASSATKRRSLASRIPFVGEREGAGLVEALLAQVELGVGVDERLEAPVLWAALRRSTRLSRMFTSASTTALQTGQIDFVYSRKTSSRSTFCRCSTSAISPPFVIGGGRSDAPPADRRRLPSRDLLTRARLIRIALGSPSLVMPDRNSISHCFRAPRPASRPRAQPEPRRQIARAPTWKGDVRRVAVGDVAHVRVHVELVEPVRGGEIRLALPPSVRAPNPRDRAGIPAA